MSDLVNAWLRLPEELKSLPQWCIAGKDKAPLLSNGNSLHNASPIKGPWLTFDQACAVAGQHNLNIGFIITASDPFTCIDLDVKDALSVKANGEPYEPHEWTKPEAMEGYVNAIRSFTSYTELSSSGKGIHIWVRGKVGKGIKRDGVELYSQERFIVCTGNTVRDIAYSTREHIVTTNILDNGHFALEERQALLDEAVKSMSVAGSRNFNLVEVTASYTDDEIIKRAMEAGNSEKFANLCRGDYQQYGFPSQSEADLALMSMFTFYSKSNEQCRRLFRTTELGKRDKAVKNNYYLDNTLKLVRAREEQEEVVNDIHAQAFKRLQDKVQTELQHKKLHTTLMAQMQRQAEPAPVVNIPEPLKAPEPPKPPSVEEYENGTPWPPGFLGYIAQSMYAVAPRPVREVAIVAALGLMAGIAGKAYNISNTGLNMYVLLIARSGVGKENMHGSISLLSKQMSELCPYINNFINHNKMASGQALTKACQEQPSFVNLMGEFGKKLKEMADGRSPSAISLQTVMTDIYQKSGGSDVVGGTAYSKAENDIASVNGVAYSMIGESTPGTAYEAMTPTMMEDGFLSRIAVIEYTGRRPPMNYDVVRQFPQDLTSHLSAIVSYASDIISQGREPCQVGYNDESWKLLYDFDKHCDDKINERDDEAYRQMWSRAHMKVLRISSLLAVSDNFAKPVIQVNHAQWAIDLIMRDITSMQARIESGDVGVTDDTRQAKVQALLRKYVGKEPSRGYAIPDRMWSKGIIPRSYIQKSLGSVQAFENYRLGKNAALNDVLRTLCDNGTLHELDKATAIREYGNGGRCFQIINLG